MTHPTWSPASAGRHVVEVPARALPGTHEHVAAQHHRGHQLPPHHRLRVDLLIDQPPQHPRALGVAEQHHPAPMVVARHVLAPGGLDVLVGDRQCLLIGLPRPVDRRDRPLAVHRREHATDLREPRRLVARDRNLLGLDRAVGVRALLVAHRGIDVEAVHLGVASVGRVLHVRPAVGFDKRGLEAAQARVGRHTRLAQPDRVLGPGNPGSAAQRAQHDGKTAANAELGPLTPGTLTQRATGRAVRCPP